MKKTLIAFVAMIMVCGSQTLIFADGTQPSGAGTELYPYEVETLDNLLWISTNDTQWDKYYIQTADIDASATSTWNENPYEPGIYLGWTPIGWASSSTGPTGYTFTGTYDGQGHTISNVCIYRVGGYNLLYNAGFFGCTEGATIKNLGLIDCSITNNYIFTGALIGWQYGGTVDNCYTTGSVAGVSEYGDHNQYGGLIGEITNSGSVSNCYSTCSVSGKNYVAGLIGYIIEGTITGCYTTGSVTGTGHSVGGLVGRMSRASCSITNSYATGSVTGAGDFVGGLVGEQISFEQISDCYATGSVSGDDKVGGLIGYQLAQTTNCSVTNCYATGSVTGTSQIGGLIGYQLGQNGYVCLATSCYWDTEVSGIDSSAAGTGKTTAEMKTQSTYINWDFTDTWSIDASHNDGYPYLQDGTEDIVGDFNGDGYVDVQDSQLFGDHWLFEQGDAGWDALYDLIVDGIIDLLDSQVFGDHWHEGTPPTKIRGEGKGPNADAGIVFDLDPAYGNQNLTHLDPQAAGTYIKVGVYCTGVHNLDTYAFNVVYNSDELTYVTATAMSSAYEPNILTTEGGTAVNWMVDTSTSGSVGCSYTLTGQDTTQAPEGEGLLGEIVFRAQVPTYGILSFENVKYSDTFGQLDNITNTGTATLPVELSAFTATYNSTNGYTSLEWTTASETDIIGFNVYRSTEDAFDTSEKLNYDVIEGHGTTTEINSYTFIDDSQLDLGTVYYYWLESVELGGINTVYTSIELTPEEGSGGYVNDFDTNSLSNFPNPVKGSTTISYAVKGMLQSQPVEIDIYNMLGQLVDTVEGTNGTATWNTSDQASGIYFYKLNTDSYTEIKKMMLVK